MSMYAPLLVAIPFLAAFAMPLVGLVGERIRNSWVILAMLATVGAALLLVQEVLVNGTLVYSLGAVDSALTIPIDSGGVPIRIIFVIDAMSAFMVLTAAIMMFSVTLYSISSESKQTGQDGYYALLFLLMAGIFGMVTTGDLFNFFVFLEINSLAGAALASYRINKGFSVEGGLKYGFISAISAMMFLFAVGMLYGQYNSLNIAYIASVIEFTGLSLVAVVLMITSLAMKSGAVPMHFWTPDTYSSAPSSITALLIISSMACLYAIFRMAFSLFGLTMNVVTVGWVIIILGVLSMFIGVAMALPQKDVKRLMAYHSVSQIGYMLTGLGVGVAVLGDTTMMAEFGFVAMEGGIFHIINYALYKGLLFLIAGAVIYRCGTKNLNELGGLGHTMKWTMGFFIIAALAIAGIPPFNGFASKLMIYESVFIFNPFISVIAMVVSIMTLASFVKVFHSMFMGPRLPQFAEVKEVPLPMLIGMGLLAVLIILFGIFPDFVVKTIVEPAALAFIDQSGYIASVMGGV
ncbi:MAG: NADH:ubiquinone oxidoreductase [Methanocalculus sp. MSAO_Arc1]|uniref:proton-conducting transporter transmembrane domain-containing protein n=1 Tax=Methanocalculus TaxID=71151 RepID=UPI000FF72C29|nr:MULTISPECIES: proton-conducting transporter membrane subunit [unclassified Methanocalculus]MCP1662793.1 multicomponent Na+:H+ antiporter subunit D [Methanocalculus sp. AMF5]RQD81065.1 MAG: NADH:ubiquinone oxidoreductase [Methanocalculus sp. MSAO_Arc1]